MDMCVDDIVMQILCRTFVCALKHYLLSPDPIDSFVTWIMFCTCQGPSGNRLACKLTRSRMMAHHCQILLSRGNDTQQIPWFFSSRIRDTSQMIGPSFRLGLFWGESVDEVPSSTSFPVRSSPSMMSPLLVKNLSTMAWPRGGARLLGKWLAGSKAFAPPSTEAFSASRAWSREAEVIKRRPKKVRLGSHIVPLCLFCNCINWQSVERVGAYQPHCAVRVSWRDPQTGKGPEKAFKAFPRDKGQDSCTIIHGTRLTIWPFPVIGFIQPEIGCCEHFTNSIRLV